MPVLVRCSTCGMSLQAPDNLAGGRAVCPKCRTVLQAPYAAPAPVGVAQPVQGSAVAPKTSGLAVASAIFGVLICLGALSGIPALIMGLLALLAIRKAQGRLGGAALAIVGICLGALSTAATAVAVVKLTSATTGAVTVARDKARGAACANNLRQIAIALERHMGDNGGKYPASLDVLLNKGYLPDARALLCPGCGNAGARNFSAASAGALPCGYVYVPYGTQRTAMISPLVFDRRANHKGEGRNVLFGDGHVEWLREPELGARFAAEAARNPEFKKWLDAHAPDGGP